MAPKTPAPGPKGRVDIPEIFVRPPRPTEIKAAVRDITDAVAESRPLTQEEVKAVLERIGGGLVEAIRIATGALATLAQHQHPRVRAVKEKLEDGRNMEGFWVLDSKTRSHKLFSIMIAAVGGATELLIAGNQDGEKRFAHTLRVDERGNPNYLELSGQGIPQNKLLVMPMSVLPRSFRREISRIRDTVRAHMGSLLQEILPELEALKHRDN